MIPADILAKIKHIQLHTKRRLTSALAGEYRSKNKGFGLDFDQIRGYEVGDDVRFIDWKSSARNGELLVKQYIHEYSKTLMLVVDTSASTLFSTTDEQKSDRLAQVGTILSIVADHYGAQLGLVQFDESVQTYLPPKRGKHQMHHVISKLWEGSAKNRRTNIHKAMQFLASLKRKDTIICFLSDFIDDDFYKILGSIHKQYDLIALRCLDRAEFRLPKLGYVMAEDPESGESIMLDLAHDDHESPLYFIRKRITLQDAEFKKKGIDCLSIWQDEPYIDALIKFFSQRMVS